jgi:predicted nucleic acid-binding protein
MVSGKSVFVLDSSAVLRLLDSEAGADRVEEILDAHMARSAEVAMSAVQWGEVAGLVRRRRGQIAQQQALTDLGFFQIRIEPATPGRAVRAAEIKEDRKLPYADAFAVELAMDLANSVLLTADFDFKKVSDLTKIEFLPLK